MTISKEIAVRLFREACSDYANDEERKLAVDVQNDRYRWGITSGQSFIRIENRSDNAKITVYPHQISLPVVIPLTQEEYKELEALYIGNYGEPNANTELNIKGKNDFLNFNDSEKLEIEGEIINYRIIEVIKALMHAEGKNENDLAKDLGVTQADLTSVFTGDKYINIPLLVTLQRIFNTTFTFGAKGLTGTDSIKSDLVLIPDLSSNINTK